MFQHSTNFYLSYPDSFCLILQADEANKQKAVKTCVPQKLIFHSLASDGHQLDASKISQSRKILNTGIICNKKTKYMDLSCLNTNFASHPCFFFKTKTTSF